MKAHVDLLTGNIYGCRMGSWKWHHEKGHISFNEKKSYLVMLQGWLFKIWLFFLMVAISFRSFYSIAVITWGLYIWAVIYEEHWCNQYANKKCKGGKNGRKN